MTFRAVARDTGVLSFGTIAACAYTAALNLLGAFPVPREWPISVIRTAIIALLFIDLFSLLMVLVFA